jgi:hypothetical protein
VQVAPEAEPLLGDGEAGTGLAGRVELVHGVEQPYGEEGGEGGEATGEQHRERHAQ